MEQILPGLLLVLSGQDFTFHQYLPFHKEKVQ